MFNESVTGVSKTNFSLSGAGASGASITAVGGSGSAYTVTASTGTDGALGLSLSTPAGIIDSVGGALAGTFTGPSYTIDKTAADAAGGADEQPERQQRLVQGRRHDPLDVLGCALGDPDPTGMSGRQRDLRRGDGADLDPECLGHRGQHHHRVEQSDREDRPRRLVDGVPAHGREPGTVDAGPDGADGHVGQQVERLGQRPVLGRKPVEPDRSVDTGGGRLGDDPQLTRPGLRLARAEEQRRSGHAVRPPRPSST